jgi:hypothetical protein
MRLRDVAYRLGLPRFWRWWTGELAPLVRAEIGKPQPAKTRRVTDRNQE